MDPSRDDGDTGNGAGGAAPGWDLIDEALESVYGDAVPLHVAPDLPAYLGGDEPLDGISIYAREAPVPHWHLITYGMSDLYAKGDGFELTLRALRRPDASQPPAWAVMLLQQLAIYVRATGTVFEPGQTLKPAELTLGDQPTRLTALVFTVDPELGVRGDLMFLQIAALTDAEYEAARHGNGSAVLDMIEPTVPLHVIDPARTSLL
jgi:Suppressor of fused protein (SUFU)